MLPVKGSISRLTLQRHPWTYPIWRYCSGTNLNKDTCILERPIQRCVTCRGSNLVSHKCEVKITSLFESNPPSEGPHYQGNIFSTAILRLFIYLIPFLTFFLRSMFVSFILKPESAVLAHSISVRMFLWPSCWSVDSSACLYKYTKLTYLFMYSFIYNVSFHSLLQGVSLLYTTTYVFPHTSLNFKDKD